MPQTVVAFDGVRFTVPETMRFHRETHGGKRAFFITDKKESFILAFEEGMQMVDMLSWDSSDRSVSYQCCKDGKYIHQRRVCDGEGSVAFFHMELEDEDGRTLCLPGQMWVKPDYKWEDAVEPVLMQLLECVTLCRGH